MKLVEYISHLTSIDKIYCILIIKTLIFFLILTIIKKIGVKILKQIKDSKKEYLYIQKYKLLINIIKLVVFILIWGKYLESFITLISLVSAGFTIALRDLIFNFFSGIYIKIKKPF